MSRLTEEQFERIARALAEPRRYAMLKQLGERKTATPCSALLEAQEISPATLSHHLKELEAAGLIATERDGRCVNVTLRRDALAAYLERLARI
jgi:ArsR family transcriptional regulator